MVLVRDWMRRKQREHRRQVRKEKREKVSADEAQRPSSARLAPLRGHVTPDARDADDTMAVQV